MLLLNVNECVPTEQLVDAVWEDRPPRDATGQLQGIVYRLRKRLAKAGAEDTIITEPGGYRIRVDPQSVDLWNFRRLVAGARAASASGEQDAAAQQYREAIALWRGAALAGIDSTEVRASATALDEERLQVRQECIEVELTLGRASELVSELTELVQRYPYRERLHAARMRALYATGRQADALSAYRHARKLLRNDLGTEPGPELQRVHQAILSHEELSRVQTVAEASPRLRAPGIVPRELPADVAGFTGRTDALRALDELLPTGQEPTGPVVVSAIAGTAGVGKTALAVHWTHRIADRFPDGQLHVNLRGYASKAPLSPIEALAALLRSLGTPAEQIPIDEAQAAGLYRTRLSDRRMLVLLDNARSVDQVRSLLPGSSGSLVIVTSRSRLTGLVARDGARRLTLDVLTADEAEALLTTVLGVERVEAEPEAVAKLAESCGYLPLALRIAAANLVDQPATRIADYVTRLVEGDRLAGLQVDDDEESSVLGALDISYRTLPPEAARLFRLLGQVPGQDFTPVAAAALIETTTDNATKLLRQLAAAHLIDEQNPGRYTLHDLLRHYAKRIADDDAAPAVERLLHSYLRTASSAVALLYPHMLRLPGPQASADIACVELDSPEAATEWLDLERSNLVAAIRHASSHGPHWLAWTLADHLRRYFWHGRHILDWEKVAKAAMGAAEREDSPKALAATRLSLADQRQCAGKYAEAAEHYRVAARQAELANWVEGCAAALTNLGLAFYAEGRYVEGAEQHQRALAQYDLVGNIAGMARCRNNLGITERELGRPLQAIVHHKRALELYRRLESVGGESTTLINLAVAQHDLSRLGSAKRCLARALVLSQEVSDQPGMCSALVRLADVKCDIGNLAEAVADAAKGVELARRIGDSLYEAMGLVALGTIQLRFQQPDQALEHHQLAHDLALAVGMGGIQTAATIGIAAAYRQLGDLESAYTLACTAVTRSRHNHGRLKGLASNVFAQILLERGQLGVAEEYVRQSLACHREAGSRIGEACALCTLGHVKARSNDPDAARSCWRKATDIFTRVNAAVPNDILSAPT